MIGRHPWYRLMRLAVLTLAMAAVFGGNAEAYWPLSPRCFQLQMWKSPGAQSYSYAVPSPAYGNKTNFTVIPVDEGWFKIMDWEGYYLTTDGTSLFPTRDWRGPNSTWNWYAFWAGNGGYLTSLGFPDRAVGNAGAFLNNLAFAEYQRHRLFPAQFATMEAGACAPFTATVAEGFTWVEDVPTPLLTLLETPAFAVPAWIQIHWGDGDEDVVNNFDPTSHTQVGNFTHTPIVPNKETCATGSLLIGWPPGGCKITSRHVYDTPGTYRIKVFMGSDWPSTRGVVVEIPVTIKPAQGTLNVLAIGDSLASGDGAPTWPASPGAGPLEFLARHTAVLPLDDAVWDRHHPTYLSEFPEGVDLSDPAILDEPHRSSYAGPANAVQLLQRERTDLAVKFQNRAWSNVPSGVEAASSRSIFGQLLKAQLAYDGVSAHRWDAIVLTAGGLAQLQRVAWCITLNCTTVGFSQMNDPSDLAPMLGDELRTLAEQIAEHDATNKAHVLVVGLPTHAFEDQFDVAPGAPIQPCTYEMTSHWFDWLGIPGVERTFLTAARAALLERSIEEINASLKAVADEKGWTFVPVDFTGHGVCQPVGRRWINDMNDSFYLQAKQGSFVQELVDGVAVFMNTLVDDPHLLLERQSYAGAFQPGRMGHEHIARQLLPHLRQAVAAKFDEQPPYFGVTPDVVVPATGPSGAIVTYTLPTATDLVDPNPQVACLPASGSTFSLGRSPVLCTATDGRGNTAEKSFDVTVVDTTKPVFGAAPDITTDQTGPSGAVVAYATPSANDTISGIASVTCVPPSGSTFPVGTTSVTCTALDGADNSETTSFSVTVRAISGNQPPICTVARPSVGLITASLHRLVPVSVLGVTDPEGDPVAIAITGVRQDEAVSGVMPGDRSPDAVGVGTPVVQLRSERANKGNGRVYHVSFTASDGRGASCAGTVTVGVKRGFAAPISGGPLFDSTVP